VGLRRPQKRSQRRNFVFLCFLIHYHLGFYDVNDIWRLAYQTGIYSYIENLALWAMSEKIGCAVDLCLGMMEYWSVGMVGLEGSDLF